MLRGNPSSSSRRRSTPCPIAPRACSRHAWTGGFRGVAIRSEPKQDGTLIGFRFPATARSVNVAGWHFHFLTADRTRGGHVLGLTTGQGAALLQEFADLRIRFPAQGPAASAGEDEIRAVERAR